MNNTKEAWLVYDSQCPICNNFALYYRVRETIDLHLVDARTDSKLVSEITKAGLDLDKGIVIKIDEIMYHGSDAMYALACIGSKYGILNKLNYYFLRSKIISRILYPILRLCRNFLLKIMGVSKINNLLKQQNH